jgi:hypothetical protein
MNIYSRKTNVRMAFLQVTVYFMGGRGPIGMLCIRSRKSQLCPFVSSSNNVLRMFSFSVTTLDKNFDLRVNIRCLAKPQKNATAVFTLLCKASG